MSHHTLQAGEHGAHGHHHFYFQVSPITTPMGIISSLKGAFDFQFHKFKNYFPISLPQVQNSDESQERQKVSFNNDVQTLMSIVIIISGQFFQVIGRFHKTTAEKLSFVQPLARPGSVKTIRLAEQLPWLGLCLLSTEQLVSIESKLLLPGPRN